MPKLGQSDELVGLGGLTGKEIEAISAGSGEPGILAQLSVLEEKLRTYLQIQVTLLDAYHPGGQAAGRWSWNQVDVDAIQLEGHGDVLDDDLGLRDAELPSDDLLPILKNRLVEHLAALDSSLPALQRIAKKEII